MVPPAPKKGLTGGVEFPRKNTCIRRHRGQKSFNGTISISSVTILGTAKKALTASSFRTGLPIVQVSFSVVFHMLDYLFVFKKRHWGFRFAVGEQICDLGNKGLTREVDSLINIMTAISSGY